MPFDDRIVSCRMDTVLASCGEAAIVALEKTTKEPLAASYGLGDATVT